MTAVLDAPPASSVPATTEPGPGTTPLPTSSGRPVTEASPRPGAAQAPPPARAGATALTGAQKAATFLAQMSPTQAGTLLARLRESEIEEIATEVARLQGPEQNEVDAVMDEFHQVMQARGYVGRGGLDFAREMLSTGLGRDRAEEIVGRLTAAFAETPFSSLRRADTRQLRTFLKDEHPQVIALVLAHLPSAQSADVLAQLSPEVQADVAHRVAVMDRTSPEVLRLVEEELARRLGSALTGRELLAVGGVGSLVEIINRSDRATERSILEWLQDQDPELAERVRSQLFVFEDIVSLDDRSIQTVLRDVQTADLAVALKGVREDVRETVQRNLSERAAANLAEEIDLLGPVRLSAVEEAQATIVQVIRTLESAGTVTLSRNAEDEFVV